MMHLLKYDYPCCIGALSQSQAHPLLGSLRLPGRPLQPQSHAQLEHFLPLRVNSSSPLSLFPNFNAVRCHVTPLVYTLESTVGAQKVIPKSIFKKRTCLKGMIKCL